MDAVMLARIQFALTVAFHYIFPPLTIGLGWMIFYYHTLYRRRREPIYRDLARFWTKMFAINFAAGVATGITMEFQFGTNWADYSRFVGDIFGAPLAAEGVFAFFLESSFLGILVYGEKKVSEKVYWFSSLMVAVGATLSAFWIVVANSWQQTPAGYEIVDGRAVLTSFWAAVFNPSTGVRYLHVVAAALVTGTFFILGVSAWMVLKGLHGDFAKASLRSAAMPALLSCLLVTGLGHPHAVQVAKTQPAKLAAFEGLWETQARAPLLLFGWPDEEAEKTDFAVGIPAGLSLLIDGDPAYVVKGLKDFKPEDRPPVLPTFFSFHTMVYLGGWFVLLAFIAVVLAKRKKLCENRLFLKAAAFTVPLPFIANELGWMSAEIGRQPWVVYNELRTADAVSAAVPAGQILASIIMFTLIYSLLFGVWWYLLKRQFHRGPGATAEGKGGAA